MKEFPMIYKVFLIFLFARAFWGLVEYIIIEKPEPMEIVAEFKDEPIQFSVCGEWKDAVITEFYEGERRP